MRLFLVRHGEAVPGNPDSMRVLTREGRESVVRLADRAAAAGVRPDRIRHSGLVRARETAEILAARLLPPDGTSQMTGLRPSDDPEAAAIELSLAEGSILIVTHMPFVAELEGRLVAGRRGVAGAMYSTAELRGFERDESRWRLSLVLAGG